MNALATSSVTRYLEIDIRSLPAMWWELLWLTVNDYLQYEDHHLYEEAVDWLFFEEFDPLLDGTDVMCFHTVSGSLNINVSRFRFELQQLKDKVKEESRKDARGRKQGFIREESLRELVEKCKGFREGD